jgi:hypothetical protein
MWSFKKPEYGSQIRVNRGLYYHHGIYESDDCVYQFASPEGSEISPETAVVCTTTLKKFLNGGDLEVREYTEEELKELKPKDEIIKYAKEHLGEMGYNLISNNCEHFSNRCAFGKSESEQVNNIFSLLGGLFS